MNYEDWKTESPPEKLKNKCQYCGEDCNNSYCSKECKKAYESEN